MSASISNVRPAWDAVIVDIVDHALGYEVGAGLALDTARGCRARRCSSTRCMRPPRSAR